MRKSTLITNLLLAVALVFAVSATFAEEYEALKGIKSAKAIFDVRIGNPKSTAIHMGLIHQTYKDLMAKKKHPAFTVVFIGPSVKLVSKNREGFSPEDQKTLDEISSTISQMSKDGIKLEICLVAAKIFNVDTATVLPEIKHVPNGWVSLIGYQANGYSLVPAY